jgi:sulfate adenylyltransferase
MDNSDAVDTTELGRGIQLSISPSGNVRYLGQAANAGKGAAVSLLPPHGASELKPLLLEGEEREQELARAAGMVRISIGPRELSDVIMMGVGGFTPLRGFMSWADWKGVCTDYRLNNGLFWPVPITLPVDEAVASALRPLEEVALVVPGSDEPVATMQVTEKYPVDRTSECRFVFGTADPKHPGVAVSLAQGRFNLAGPVKVLSQGDFAMRYPGVYLTPAETRALFQANGWSTIAAFQTRNPMHRSHEHLVRLAAADCDGVLIHSALGYLKPGDVPAEVSVRAIALLVERYLQGGKIVQAGHPLAMRYAGPREALLHALFRQNYGCSHLIVGRDHAGTGSFYGPLEAQRIFDVIPRGSLHIKPINIDETFWCYRCDRMASASTCEHAESVRLRVSGSSLRKALAEGAEVPAEFSRPEVLQLLREYYASTQEKVDAAS